MQYFIVYRDGSDISKTRDLKDKDGKLVLSGATDDDCRTIRRVCEAVSTRAARLAAAGVVALVRKVCQFLVNTQGNLNRMKCPLKNTTIKYTI